MIKPGSDSESRNTLGTNASEVFMHAAFGRILCVLFVASTVILGAGVTSFTAASQTPGQRFRLERPVLEAYLSAEEFIWPAVVRIRSRTSEGTETERSGFTVLADGVLVTNLSTVSGKEIVSVEFPGGEVFASAEVLATDSARDIAILKVLGTDLPHVELGDSDEVAIGDAVMAVGRQIPTRARPGGAGLRRDTYAFGHVEAVRPMEPIGRVLLTDNAWLRDGGAPVVNAAAEVIGILPAEVAASGPNLIIPINYVRSLLAGVQIR